MRRYCPGIGLVVDDAVKLENFDLPGIGSHRNTTVGVPGIPAPG